MIKVSDGKVGTREFISIVLLSTGIKLSDTSPNLLFTDGKNAAWTIPFLSFVILIVPFFILISLLKKHEIGLMDLLSKLMGKIVGGIIGFCLFFIMFNSTVINSRGYVDIVNTMFYPKTPVPALLLMLLATSYFVSKRGLEMIGRTAWIVIPTILFSQLLLIAFVWKDIDWMHLFPIGGPGLKHIMKESITHSSIFGDIILLAAFYPFVRTFKDFRLASLLGFGISCLQIALFVAIYVMVFDYPEIINMAFPFQQLTRMASIGETLTHIEALFLGLWLISSVIHFAIYLYLSAFFFAGALRIKEFELLLLPLAGLAFFLGLVPENIFQLNQYREFFLIIITSMLIFLPVFLWIADRWKGRRKDESV
ncbi:GerAB/ArcD/ProY family transporter [Bacillus sp. FJAT-29790]|uniref:GerAB/ArcD/ProY family transporter n=1 Tax=Bacillus sp. FJAT-29790 TaxID=1895002 RepID=UPI001C220A0C|nr:GerAB/ArcD/ProY family transporter [Bacillus sp. FJAT-29790]MBU8880069.1 GerAB/ArcD/ProY family transporter [Bacillus sp. FJAT-29790]